MSSQTAATARNAALLSWYASNSRSLPWRGTSNPYHTIVSEFMLQQTQVERVIPRYRTFVERWSTIEELAESQPGQVLQMWSGLGYNSRALRLRSSALAIRSGGWPRTVAGLMKLPGVGSYTASAIASIAFGESVPAVDTNLRRVLGRWFGASLNGDPLVSFAQDSLGSPAGDWNQALMDLGALLCRPRNPQCPECPVSEWCTDSTVYEAPVRQSAFRGSNRELRGALVRAHLDGLDLHTTGISIGRTKQEVRETIAALTSEGLLPT